MKRENVFTTFIHLLKVNHTLTYSVRYFNEHPHKYDLYGISKMLSDYGIENMGIKVSDKSDLYKLEAPFIAHISIDFVVVTKVTEEKVHYIWDGKRTEIPIQQFLDVWTGIVLIAEPGERSIEPSFYENRRKEWIEKSQKLLLSTSLCLLILSSLFLFNIYREICS